MALGSLNTTKGWAELLAEVRTEFDKWGVKDVAYPTKKDALISGRVSVLVLGKNGDWQEIECGAFDGKNGPERNLCAIREAVRGVRLADQRGIGQVLVGVTQLLSLPAAPEATGAHAVLGVSPTDTQETIRQAYRRRVKETHPDQGGDPAEFLQVQAAGRELGVA